MAGPKMNPLLRGFTVRIKKIPRCWDVGSAVSDVRGLAWTAIASHLHSHLASVQHIAVHPVHRIFRVAPIEKPYKSKASGLLGEPIPRDVYVSDLAKSLEDGLELLWGDSVGEVIHFQTHHPTNVWRSSPSVRISRAAAIPTPASTSPSPAPASAPVSVPASAPTAHGWLYCVQLACVASSRVEREDTSMKAALLAMRMRVGREKNGGGWVVQVEEVTLSPCSGALLSCCPLKEEAKIGDHH